MASKRKLKTSTRIRKGEQTAPRIVESPLARMKRTSALNVWELTAADEIIAAYRMSVGEPVNRDPDLGVPPSEPRPDAADETAAKRSDVLRTWMQWKANLRATAPYAAVMSILISDSSFRTADRMHGWRNGSASGYFVAGLRHFAALRGNVPRSARNWKLETQTVNTKVDC